MSELPTETETAERNSMLLAWQRLRFALGAAGIGTWFLDLRSRVATFDESLNSIFGLEPVETHSPLSDRLASIHPDDRDRVRRTVDKAIADRTEFSIEFRILRTDGAIRWVRDRGRIFTDEDGAAIVATGAVMDVTDRRRIEERDRMLADATQMLAATMDQEQALVALAQALVPRFALWCTVHLRERDTLLEMAFAGNRRLAPDHRRIAEVSETGAPSIEGETMVIPVRAGDSSMGAIAFVGEQPFAGEDVAFASELADRVALSVDRARLFADLERANRVKDEFLATLSHELRTPLNAVLGWTKILLRGSVPPDRTISILETIERNAAAQMQLVEELLDLSAMAAGGLRLTVTRVDLRELIGGAVETIRPAADAKSIRITVAVQDHIGEIAGDPARLRQVLWNLLANAVKFTPADGAIHVSLIETAADVEITVRDSGPGIEAEFLPHVFDAFRQGEAGGTRGGLGLGLAIVRHIVEAHGGTATVSSDGAGTGSNFSVRLPSGRPRHADMRPGGGLLRGRRVLAVDDDASTQELVATMLLMYGVSVRTAGRAGEALKILSEWRPDVLLTDIAMPGEDGYALMRKIRSMPPPIGTIPAVALTAFTDPHSVQSAFGAGFDAHLGKPLEPHVLADALAKVLRLRRST